MKKLAKKFVVSQLGGYVRTLRNNNDFKVVVVVGSIGKTSTKLAIAKVLQEKYSVQYQNGNYNDLVSVPLIFFGLPMPSLTNPLAWHRTFAAIKRQLKNPYPYDVVVVEVGTDGPGQIAEFASYLHADVTVVTAITPEHMEFFTDLDAVAAEEFSVASYSKQLVINANLTDQKYIKSQKVRTSTYGKNAQADYVLGDIKFERDKAHFSLVHKGKTIASEEVSAVSVAELYSAAAAAAVAEQLGLAQEQINTGLRKLEPVSGRMQRLKGINNSLIIDETYNASPVAVKAALDSLYELKAPQKIAVLGTMNELGAMSPEAHKEVGEYCEPGQLDLVVTIGADANNNLAPAAEQAGCSVKSFDNPYEAGTYLRTFIKPDAVILAKGSQNGVFAEETVKLLLADPEDATLLVRQSNDWLAKKEKQFGKVS